MKHHDNNTMASDSVNIRISDKKLKKLRPDLYGIEGLLNKNMKNIIKEHIHYGDSQPAIVISTEPLLIAAYSDELDCVAILNFPEIYVKEYNLVKGTRLLTINTYISLPPFQADLIIGPGYLNRWFGFHPIIGEFVSEDINVITSRKNMFVDEHWSYVSDLATEYLIKHKNVWRDGRPILSQLSAL